MNPFRYERASDASAAIALLAPAPSAAFLGRGTNRADLRASEGCIAAHRWDMAGAVVGLDAGVRVLGANGERTIPLVNFHRLPGDEPQRDTVLERGELITAGDLPPLAFATHPQCRKV